MTVPNGESLPAVISSAAEQLYTPDQQAVRVRFLSHVVTEGVEDEAEADALHQAVRSLSEIEIKAYFDELEGLLKFAENHLWTYELHAKDRASFDITRTLFGFIRQGQTREAITQQDTRFRGSAYALRRTSLLKFLRYAEEKRRIITNPVDTTAVRLRRKGKRPPRQMNTADQTLPPMPGVSYGVPSRVFSGIEVVATQDIARTMNVEAPPELVGTKAEILWRASHDDLLIESEDTDRLVGIVAKGLASVRHLRDLKDHTQFYRGEQRTIERAAEARELLFRGFLPIIGRLAWMKVQQYSYRSNLLVDDLVQAGAEGLLKAIDNYAAKPSHERLSAGGYFVTGIQAAMRREIANALRLFPSEVPKSPIVWAYQELESEGLAVTPAALGKKLGISIGEAEVALRAIQTTFSYDPLDLQYIESPEESLDDTFGGLDEENLIKLETYLAFIPPQQARMLRLRYGVDTVEGAQATHKEITEMLRTHETYVSALTSRALEEVRQIAVAFDEGTLDYERIRRKGIRNAFMLFHYAGVEPPQGVRLQEVNAAAGRLLQEFAYTDQEYRAVALLYSLDSMYKHRSASQVGRRLRRGAGRIRQIEQNVLARMRQHAEAQLAREQAGQLTEQSEPMADQTGQDP